MNVVRAWYVSWNDWNVPHVHGPCFNAPLQRLTSLKPTKENLSYSLAEPNLENQVRIWNMKPKNNDRGERISVKISTQYMWVSEWVSVRERERERVKKVAYEIVPRNKYRGQHKIEYNRNTKQHCQTKLLSVENGKFWKSQNHFKRGGTVEKMR